MNNIFESGELVKDEVTFNPNDSTNSGIVLIINPNAKTQPLLYNLDAIISIGYRVNSKEATEFRKWSTQILKEYMIKGFVLDKELLKQGKRFNKDYFTELLEDIREIRASERRFYEKITDIYATSYDYNVNATITKEFFANVQNKLHYAVSGMTAPEIIINRADASKEHMGLTSWKNAPEGKIRLSDTKIAKNYLGKKEIRSLERIVNMLLDYAEDQAERHNPMSMQDWITRVDKFLDFNEYNILKNKGKVSRLESDEYVKKEFEKFRPLQDKSFKSDYNKFVDESRKLIE